jgi:hypothetical protein
LFTEEDQVKSQKIIQIIQPFEIESPPAPLKHNSPFADILASVNDFQSTNRKTMDPLKSKENDLDVKHYSDE